VVTLLETLEEMGLEILMAVAVVEAQVLWVVTEQHPI
jgi:hypothetical protein